MRDRAISLALACLVTLGACAVPVFAAGARDAAALPVSAADAHAAAKRLAELMPASTPPSQITAVLSDAGSVYAARPDGAWLIQSNARPGQDTLTLTLQSPAGGTHLRLDFPTDAALPSGGPGVAGNGNSVIGEIEVELGGQAVKAHAHASVSQSNAGRVAATAFDGVRRQGDAGWDAEASGFETGGGQPAWIVAKLERPIPPGSSVRVRIIARSKWGQHVPGVVSAAVVGGPEAERAMAQLAELRGEFDAWRGEQSKRLRVVLASADADNEIESVGEARRLLAQDELLRSCGPDAVWAVATRKGGEAFLRAMLADTAWMEMFLTGGVEGTGRADFAQALENLRLLHSRNDPATWDDPVSRRLATAMSLQAGAMNRYRFVERFTLIERSRHGGLLHAGFDHLDVRAMRHAVDLGGRRIDYEHSVNDVAFTAGGYLGACWAIPYVGHSTYGFSIQGWGFHDPLRHAYPTTMVFRSIGGVCGTLSGYGANAAISHGVPAFTVGQPGHCAYVVRLGDRWATGNDVSGPATNSWTAYEGLSFMSTNALLEPTENAAAYGRATRLAWAARSLRDADAKDAERWSAAYERSIAAQPTNYARWVEYIKAVEASPPETPLLSAEAWIAMGRRAATAFAPHHEAGWALAMRCYKAGQAATPTPDDRVKLLVETHKTLCQKNDPPLDYGYPLVSHFLDQQADWIGDPAASVRFFGELLVVHRSDDAARNWVFAQVMSWGGNRFAGNPATASAYAEAIGSFFAAQGDSADKSAIAAAIAAGIRKASEADDPASYQTWQTLAAKLLPPLTPGDVHLNPAQLQARPAFEPFPGDLLSANAMLRTSSASYDKPLSYKQVLDGGPLGYFDTANEQKPWATVTLAGEGELSGIVLVTRYEVPAEHPWHVPLKVEISSDGRQWTRVASIDTYEPVMRIDLSAEPVRARYVRIERQPGPDAAKPNTGRLHMRSFLVYGRKLY